MNHRIASAVLVLYCLILFLCSRSLSAQDFYWDSPVVLQDRNARYPQAASGRSSMAVVWQEFVSRGEEKGDIYLSLATGDGTSAFRKYPRFAGPFPFTGRESSIFSMVMTPDNVIIIAVSTTDKSVTILMSEDGGMTFQTTAELTTPEVQVTPRMFRKADGGFILFTTRNTGDSLSISYSVSRDGKTWSDLGQLVQDPVLRPNFLPYHISHNGTEYVVFQYLLSSEEKTYQIFLTRSTDGGSSWSSPVRISNFTEKAATASVKLDLFDNQRPHLAVAGDTLFLSWERSYERAAKQIYIVEINPDGSFRKEPEKVTSGSASSYFPQIIESRGSPLLVWFDNRRGEDNVFVARKNGVFWEETRVSVQAGISQFPRPVVFSDNLFVFWENRSGNTSRLMFCAPDRSVASPKPEAVNFTPGKREPLSTAIFSWGIPEDSSGIAGFSFVWDRHPDTKPPESLLVLRNERRKEFRADEDGSWFFHISAQDYAGNWSSPAHLEFFRDTTPPAVPEFTGPVSDDTGVLTSNSFTIEWLSGGEPDIAGYSYSIQSLSEDYRSDPEAFRSAVKSPPARIMSRNTVQSYSNLDNGLWAFSVRAIDASGNIGDPGTIFLRLDKYVPVTYISDVRPQIDIMGSVSFSITGRGFSDGGNVTGIVIDSDGREPWDYFFELKHGDFKVRNDRTIQGPVIREPKGGSYKVGVIHPTRGLQFTRSLLSIETPGTVKFGDYSYTYESVWKIITKKLFFIRGEEAAVWAIVLCLALCVVWLSVRIVGLLGEGYIFRLEMKALLSGQGPSTPVKRERIYRMHKKGMGLRTKFAFFVMVLVVAIVLMSAIPFGYYMIDSQEKTLARSLEKKTAVLMESLAQGARTYLPLKSTLELGLLLQQTAAMEEAQYATITGEASGGGSFDAVWATNDPGIQNKIDIERLEAGKSIIADGISEKVKDLASRINTSADEQVSAMVKELESLNAEALRYAVRTDAESQKKVEALQTVIQSLDSKVNFTLNRIAFEIGSEPAFESQSISSGNRLYTFYKPIVYRARGQNTYYRGLVRLCVSTDNILNEINESRDQIIRITAFIALIAVGIGILGSLLLASITITPIKRLVRGVEIIRDTDDKADLKNHIIAIKTRDELSVLADTVNEMTQGLVRAAIANKDLTVGKEVQKMFIPLERDMSGRKLTTGKESTGTAEFFGYYEGAKGVSGDYFDFLKLDDQYYAIIKCDVAGKGVPAALIMVEVATIFLSYFKDWQTNKKNIDLTVLVYRINDLLEERGFKGRFAALTVALLDTQSGECRLCNAGDTLIHIYEAASRKMVMKELPKAPAAGVFPSMLVEMQSPFKQFILKISRGDIVFFFTDGLEEAKRHFRDASLEMIECREQGLKEGDMHGNHQFGTGDEEFGIERIQSIVTAVHEGGRYSLIKYHNYKPDEKLEFDFSGCTGTAEETILALVSVEKIFRIFPDPGAGKDRRVQVDRKIDEFLKNHFLQYREYFSDPVTATENTEYVYYSHIREDEQYDDLTILGIRMKN